MLRGRHRPAHAVTRRPCRDRGQPCRRARIFRSR
jgi:hypothetical protein